MKNKKTFLLIILVLLLLIGIGTAFVYFNQEPKEEPQEVENIPDEKEINYDVNINDLEDKNDYYEVNFQKVSEDTLGADKINQFIEEKVEDFKEKANSEVPDLKERGFMAKYTLDIKIESFQTEKYLSYVLKTGEYTGGANTNQVIESFIFSKEENEELKLSDIIEEGEKDSFMGEVRARLEQKDTFPNVAKNIFFSDLHSFYVTNEEIIILFSKYEVAPGVAGIVEVRIDKEGLIK